MNPIKRKQLTKELSLTLDMDHDKVETIVRAYFNRVQEAMAKGEHNNIHLPELGLIYALDYRLDKKLEKLNSMKENVDPLKSMRNYSIVNTITKDLVSLENLKKMLDEEKERKKLIREKRYGNLEDNKSDI